MSSRGRKPLSREQTPVAYNFRMRLRAVFLSPVREIILAILLVAALAYHYVLSGSIYAVLVVAILGSVMPFWGALRAVKERKITIEAFNFFALAVSFATGEYASAAFIALMLTVASWLEWRTESRASNAVEELLKLKPTTAVRETGDTQETIDIDLIREGDILIVKNGERVPADGVVVFGSAFINEASLTGESKPIEKKVGDQLFSSTLSESGVIKIRATKVGKDSVLERMAALIAEAAKNKSKAERLADRFSGIFLPIVLVMGVGIYLVTHSVVMVTALFLIVCADDIAVSIPLAVTASLGYAAKRGVIIKGGEWLQALAAIDTLVFDKTGTLTYGTFALASVELEPGIDSTLFWSQIATAEKYSEHPVGKALYAEALKQSGTAAPDPAEVKVIRAAGIWVRSAGHEIAIGNERLAEELGLTLTEAQRARFLENERRAETTVLVFLDKAFAGILGIADVPKTEARAALQDLKQKGIRLIMLTGDNEDVAKEIAGKLGIEEYRAGMTPESKLREIELLTKTRKLAMVGDGVNDAPALARASVGIAMGTAGTAVAVEAANVIILTDRIDRIGDMVDLARRTVSVVNLDIGIWVITNIVGIILVFTGIATPAFAALYNLLTDFLPLINSARLFTKRGASGAG